MAQLTIGLGIAVFLVGALLYAVFSVPALRKRAPSAPRMSSVVVIIGLVLFVGGLFLGPDELSTVTKVTPVVSADVPKASVTFTSDPEGAKLIISNSYKGKTPVTVPVPINQEVAYRLEPAEPYADYDLYKPYNGKLNVSGEDAINVWIDRTTTEEQQAQQVHREQEQQEAEAKKLAREEAVRLEKLSQTQLIIEGFSWTRDDDYQSMIYEGKVTNNTDTTLQYAKVSAEFYTKDKQFISSDWTYLDITSLLPGQSSTFKGYANWNPAADTAQINFVDRKNAYLISTLRENLP